MMNLCILGTADLTVAPGTVRTGDTETGTETTVPTPGTGEVSGFYLVTSNVGHSQPPGAGVTGVRRETPPHTVYSEQEFKLGKQSNSYRLDYIKNILNK